MSASPMVSNQRHGREERVEERNVEKKGWSRAPNGGRDGSCWAGPRKDVWLAKAVVSSVSWVSCIRIKFGALVSHVNPNSLGNFDQVGLPLWGSVSLLIK